MVDRIQKTGHKQSAYDRQTGEWRCDGARIGSPCATGPGDKGTCPHATAGIRHPCKPKSISGEYKCQRSDELGGPCKNGPDEFGGCGISYPPCRPIAGDKRKRRLWSKRMIVLAVALLALLLGADHMKTWMHADNISFQHRFSDDCESCHAMSGDSFSDWWIVGNKNLWSHEPTKSYPCTDCHQFDGPPMQAHNLDEEKLISIAQHLNPELNPMKVDKIVCHQCHQEHKGPNGIDANLNNQQCQTCHQKAYSGFNQTHPEFTNFPEVKQQRPLFDHSKHFKRFKQGKYKSTRPEDCSSCHMTDQAGKILMPQFDQACASCHLQKDVLNVGGKQATAVSWLTVPRFDADSLSIGLWPNCKTSGNKTVDTLSPITLSLLNVYPQAQTAIQLLSENKTRLDKVEKASDEEKAAMTQLAWSFKKLLWDMSEGKKIKWAIGEPEMSKRDKELLNQTTSINADMLTLFTTEFFTDLDETVGQNIYQAQGQCIDKTQYKELKKQWGKSKVTGMQGWYVQFNSKTLELGYRTQQHKDVVQQALMDQYWYDPSLFSWLKEKKKGINCQKCHSQNSQNTAWVWKQEATSFSTRFEHKPHLILGVNCSDCHQVKQPIKDKEKSELNQSLHVSDFKNMSKDNCQQCHNPKGSPEKCSTCHSYHGEVLMRKPTFKSWDESVSVNSDNK